MGAKDSQKFGPMEFDMSSTSGYMGAKYFQEFGLRFVVCHLPNVVCHGVSISSVSISSVLCRVRILRVSVSMPCCGHLVTSLCPVTSLRRDTIDGKFFYGNIWICIALFGGQEGLENDSEPYSSYLFQYELILSHGYGPISDQTSHFVQDVPGQKSKIFLKGPIS